MSGWYNSSPSLKLKHDIYMQYKRTRHLYEVKADQPRFNLMFPHRPKFQNSTPFLQQFLSLLTICVLYLILVGLLNMDYSTPFVTNHHS